MGVARFRFLILSMFVFAFGAAASADNASFVIKPYLFTTLGQGIAVGWQYGSTKPTGTPSVRVWKNGQFKGESFAIRQGDQFLAKLPMPNCGFGNDVTYAVTGQPGPLPIAEIPCAWSQRDDSPVRFSFLADSQEGPKFVKQFAQIIGQFGAQAVLHGGDIVHVGDDRDQWVDYFQAMESVGLTRVLFPAVGNHEYRHTPSVPLWKEFFGYEAKDTHYAFDLGPAHIIALNSNFEDDPTQREGQLAWLERELAVPARWKIVYYHHPAFSVGIANSAIAPKKEYIVLQDHYLPLFEKYNVDLVLNGHVHLFETSKINNVRYITVGPAGGKMGWLGGNNPYVIKHDGIRTIVNLTLNANNLQADSVGIDGSLIDSLKLSKR